MEYILNSIINSIHNLFSDEQLIYSEIVHGWVIRRYFKNNLRKWARIYLGLHLNPFQQLSEHMLEDIVIGQMWTGTPGTQYKLRTLGRDIRNALPNRKIDIDYDQ